MSPVLIRSLRSIRSASGRRVRSQHSFWSKSQLLWLRPNMCRCKEVFDSWLRFGIGGKVPVFSLVSWVILKLSCVLGSGGAGTKLPWSRTLNRWAWSRQCCRLLRRCTQPEHSTPGCWTAWCWQCSPLVQVDTARLSPSLLTLGAVWQANWMVCPPLGGKIWNQKCQKTFSEEEFSGFWFRLGYASLQRFDLVPHWVIWL